MTQTDQKELPSCDSQEVVASTNWLQLKSIHWTDASGTRRKWDMVEKEQSGSSFWYEIERRGMGSGKLAYTNQQHDDDCGSGWLHL
jgi:hypothetical protein